MEERHKGRGAQINPANPFEKNYYTGEEGPIEIQKETQFIDVKPKTVINKVNSPDVPFPFSINPYQGCEHGCIYCYARNTHPYWGYSAGLDFEQKILVKKEAAVLLEKQLRSKKWKAAPISLSGNTDCYQPIERKLGITRSLLEVFLKYKHPVGIITKNSLILRDVDLLKELAALRLVKVAVSITTLDESLRRRLEPRTATAKQRLKVIEDLAAIGIPVTAMMAPIIPGLNSYEIFNLVKETCAVGASSIAYTVVRLNGDVEELFVDWLERNYPDRQQKVLGLIADCHGGKVSDHRFKTRMRGEGNIADMIHQQFKLAKNRFLKREPAYDYDLSLHAATKDPQLRLF